MGSREGEMEGLGVGESVGRGTSGKKMTLVVILAGERVTGRLVGPAEGSSVGFLEGLTVGLGEGLSVGVLVGSRRPVSTLRGKGAWVAPGPPSR